MTGNFVNGESKMNIIKIFMICICVIFSSSIVFAGDQTWTVEVFVDNFGDSTKEKYITIEAPGIFSNSATSNSDCPVKIIVSIRPDDFEDKWEHQPKHNVGIFLYEYGRSRNVPAYFIGKSGMVRMKNNAGVIMTAPVIGKWSSSGGLSVSEKVVTMLKESAGVVKFSIIDRSSVYDFSINADGFLSVYNMLPLASVEKAE